ncbi:hypothetical protein EGR_07221 [Echinococcus granulosus]|uniref:Uncharacterized protein n=1 Tax=Echinococcus granulosus TaxID=6210 RepID=W6UBN5_ECHGR|nr:hypothetical protein EGR_07221 [Echinococcus granulosus]EUB57951.1 hypothetical protein EGR_07221 [Echinococcus granulosus]
MVSEEEEAGDNEMQMRNGQRYGGMIVDRCGNCFFNYGLLQIAVYISHGIIKTIRTRYNCLFLLELFRYLIRFYNSRITCLKLHGCCKVATKGYCTKLSHFRIIKTNHSSCTVNSLANNTIIYHNIVMPRTSNGTPFFQFGFSGVIQFFLKPCSARSTVYFEKPICSIKGLSLGQISTACPFGNTLHNGSLKFACDATSRTFFGGIELKSNKDGSISLKDQSKYWLWGMEVRREQYIISVKCF